MSTPATAASFVCRPCGYQYDPPEGDLEAGVQPGTVFDAIPESWFCPVCGAGKEFFAKSG